MTQKTSQKRYEYDDIVEFSIDFNDLFKQKEVIYFVYIYSKNCLHCELIKDDVISYSFDEKVPTYFIEYDKSIKVEKDVSDTIGASDVSEVAIMGTPTLLLIQDKHLTINVSGMDLVKNVLIEYN